MTELLLVAAGVAFVLEGLEVVFGRLALKWWALGVALYVFAQVA